MRPTRTTISLVAGLALLALGIVALAVRYLAIPGHGTLYVVMTYPVLAVAAPVAAVVLLIGRHWLPATLAVGLTAALIAVELPLYVGEATTRSLPVRVMTINMRLGNADAAALVQIAAQSADVVMVEELTADAAGRLKAAGIGQAFPYQAIDPRPEAAGTGIYSRHAMTEHHFVRGFQLALVTATLRIAGSSAPVYVVALHAAAPWPLPIAGWRADFTALPTLLAHLAETAGSAPVLVGGDFNATTDMKPFRDLLTDGYRDAAEQAGAGRLFTFPTNTWYPPLIGIDHVLTRNASAVSLHTVAVPNSDHRGLLATVMVA